MERILKQRNWSCFILYQKESRIYAGFDVSQTPKYF